MKILILVILIILSSCATIPQSELSYSKKPKAKHHTSKGISIKNCNL